MEQRINWEKVRQAMEKEVEDNLCSKCKICGIVVNDVEGHLNMHKKVML